MCPVYIRWSRFELSNIHFSEDIIICLLISFNVLEDEEIEDKTAESTQDHLVPRISLDTPGTQPKPVDTANKRNRRRHVGFFFYTKANLYFLCLLSPDLKMKKREKICIIYIYMDGWYTHLTVVAGGGGRAWVEDFIRLDFFSLLIKLNFTKWFLQFSYFVVWNSTLWKLCAPESCILFQRHSNSLKRVESFKNCHKKNWKNYRHTL